MPIVQIYTGPNQLTSSEKQELATALTARYTKILPAFFVNIIFNEISADSFFLGAKPIDNKFIRLVISHIAVNYGDDRARANNYLDFVGEVLKERFEKRGWQWEYHVEESNRDLWRVQSLVPPPLGSDGFKLWEKEGRAVPWTEEGDSKRELNGV